ncbi:MAG: hypothetical protein ACP5XB_15165 [Isosphaeraceae bacterium]
MNISSSFPSSCLVEVRQEPDVRFTARLLGLADLSASATTREEGLEELRSLLQERVNLGSLVCMEVPRRNPLMRWFGHAKDDPTFDEYLEEIRKYREEMDRQGEQGPDSSECSNTSSIPTT